MSNKIWSYVFIIIIIMWGFFFFLPQLSEYEWNKSWPDEI